MTFSDGMSLSSLLVTIAGFAVAIWQLWKTRTATEAAASAMQSSALRMRQNHLLLLIPQLQAVEVDLDYACDTDDRKAARRALLVFSQTANQVAALLGTIEESDQAFITSLKATAEAAAQAKGRIASDSRVRVATAVRPVLELVTDVGSRAAGLATQYQMRVA